AEALVDHLEGLVRERGQQALRRDGTEGSGILGVVDVGGGVLALGQDEVRHLGRGAVTCLDGNAGCVGALLEQRPDQLLAPARIDRDAAGPGRLLGGGGAGGWGVVRGGAGGEADGQGGDRRRQARGCESQDRESSFGG